MQELVEVPSIGIYSVTLTQTDCLHITVYSWSEAVWPGTMDLVTSDNLHLGLVGGIDCNVQFCLHSDLRLAKCIPPLNRSLPDIDTSKIMTESPNSVISNLLQDAQFNSCVDHLIEILLQSVKLRVFNQVIWAQTKKLDSELNALPHNSTQQTVETSSVADQIPQAQRDLSHDQNLEQPGDGVITGQSKVAILFSGGVDSAVITALVDK